MTTRTLLAGIFLALLTIGQAQAGFTSVPEPASLSLLALAVGGVALAKFRGKR